MSDSLDCSPPGSSVHWGLQARIVEWGCHALLQGIIRTQELNPHLLCLLHWQVGSFPLVPPGMPYLSNSTKTAKLKMYAFGITLNIMNFRIKSGFFFLCTALCPNVGKPMSCDLPACRQLLWSQTRVASSEPRL